jgi:hypothetical protein
MIVHNFGEGCGQAVSGPDVALIKPRKSRDTSGMQILPRLIAIAIRKYADQPSDRAAAVRMLLLNAMRLAISHLGREQAASITRDALREPVL